MGILGLFIAASLSNGAAADNMPRRKSHPALFHHIDKTIAADGL
jgi:hypothetical protein